MLSAKMVRSVPRNLASLQAGRAVAAILVVLFHDSVIFGLPKYWGAKPFGRIFDFGNSGVMFFFVLSGFIILHAHYQDLDRGKVGEYVYKRFRRIYPTYWVVLSLVLPVYFMVRSFGEGFETQPEVILSSFLLIHFETLNPVIAVSWTLFHEVLFYALFAVVIWRAQLGFSILGLWLALSAVSMVTDRGSVVTRFYVSNLHLLFGFGMIAAWWLRRSAVVLPITAAFLGVTLFLWAGMDQVYLNQMNDNQRMLVYGLGATVAMMGLVELERGSGLRLPKWLLLLGDASYSIYLVHFFVLSLLAKLVWATGAENVVPPIAAYTLLACLAIIFGLFFHLWIERPLLTLLGRSPSFKS
jgi:exopolysaccharide production protein ExoZ